MDRSNVDKVVSWLKQIKSAIQTGDSGPGSMLSMTSLSMSRGPAFFDRIAHSASATPDDLSPLR